MNAKTETPSIAERMAARRSEAEAKIKALLWKGNDTDEAAALALAGGIEPAAAERMAAGVAAAKILVRAATEANERLPELQAAHAAAEKSARAAASKLEAAERAHDEAQDALGDAAAKLQAATGAREDAARQFGTAIPEGLAPPFLVEIVAGWKASKAASLRASRIDTLKRRAIPARENRVAAWEAELASQKRDDPDKENRVVGAGGLVDTRSALEARIRTEKEALKAEKAELAALENESPA